jgi:hypothetical protein
MDLDGPSLNEMALGEALGEAAAQAYEDEEYKIWKQVTKKDRALVAKERFALFKDNHLNVDAPALLRSKAAMRRFLKGQKEAERQQAIASDSQADTSGPTENEPQTNETLAEEMEGEEVRVIPDYYEPLSLVPGVTPSLRWTEDGEGQVINHHEWSLSLVPPEHFRSPVSAFTKRMESNIRQIQETRRLATKISVIKQMQIQSQVSTITPTGGKIMEGSFANKFDNRSTQINSQNPILILSWRLTSTNTSSRTKVQSWLETHARMRLSAPWVRSCTKLVSRNCSQPPLTLSQTSLPTTFKSLYEPLTSTEKRIRSQPPALPASSSSRGSHRKKSFSTRLTRTVVILHPWRSLRETK